MTSDSNFVLDNLKDKIYLADSDETYNLRLYHFSVCDNDASQDLKKTRGVIKHNDDIICQTQGYIDEKIIQDVKFDDLNIQKITLCEDGTALRLFFYKDKWFLSSHKKINAFNSFWANSKSFGEQFCETLREQANINFNQLTDLLDQNFVYSFILKCVDLNRITCFNNNNSKIWIAGIYDKFGLLNKDAKLHCELINYPNNYNFLNPQELELFLDQNLDKYSGVLINDNLKVITKNYQTLFMLRNNEANLQKRYLDIIFTKDLETYTKFCLLYKDYQNLFKQINSDLNVILQTILYVYFERYIKKKILNVHPTIHKFLKKMHAWHCENRQQNKISEKILYDLFIQQKTNFALKCLDIVRTSSVIMC